MFSNFEEEAHISAKPYTFAGVTIPGWLMGFDPMSTESQRAQEVLDFLGVVRE
jgi:hypothetical protein